MSLVPLSLFFFPPSFTSLPHHTLPEKKTSTQCTGSVCENEGKIKSKFLSSMSAFMSFFEERIISDGTRAASTGGVKKMLDEEGFCFEFFWSVD